MNPSLLNSIAKAFPRTSANFFTSPPDRRICLSLSACNPSIWCSVCWCRQEWVVKVQQVVICPKKSNQKISDSETPCCDPTQSYRWRVGWEPEMILMLVLKHMGMCIPCQIIYLLLFAKSNCITLQSVKC